MINFKYFIPLLFAGIIFGMIFSSCEAYRNKILRSCPVNTVTKIKDSITVKEVLKRDSVYIYKTGPIQYFPNPCALLCDSIGNLKQFYSESKKNGIKQTLQTKGNVLIQNCDIDSLLQVNEKLTREITILHSKEQETQVHENCKLDHRTDFDGVTWYWFWISAGLLTMWLIKKFAWSYISTYLPFLKALKPPK